MILIFRALVVVSTVLYTVGFWLADFRFELNKPEVYDLLTWDGFDAKLTDYPVWNDYGLFVITVVISALLFFLVPFARRAYLFLIIVYAASTFLWGVRVYTPLEHLIWGLVSMTDGALLTMIYLTSVAQRFEKSAAQQGVPADVARPAGERRG